jgi:Zn finger protein HypA/HybF involved in hydrogenase expression
MTAPVARCRACGSPREVPVDGERACSVCGSRDIALADADTARGHELVSLKARDDQEPPEAVVYCKQCGAELEEPAGTPVAERTPCPRCRSRSRTVGIALAGTVTPRTTVAAKGKSPSRPKPFMEQKAGDSYSSARGKWMRVLQVVDRRNNRYRKLVTDPETGEVLRDVDKPLTEHVGRGDARKKNRS